MDDEKFMERCITLARRGLGYTYPNPLVGCVIVYKGKIISEGWHKKQEDLMLKKRQLTKLKISQF